MVQTRATEFRACFSPASTCVHFVYCWWIKLTEVTKSPPVYLGIRCAGSVSHLLKAHLPTTTTLCYQPYAHWLCLPSMGPASDSHSLAAPDFTWWAPGRVFGAGVGGQRGAEAGGREGEPMRAVWQDLLPGRRVQFTAGTLGALRLGSPLVMRPSEPDSTICLSSNLCNSDQWAHAPQTQEQCLKQPSWIYRPQMLPMPEFKQRHEVLL